MNNHHTQVEDLQTVHAQRILDNARSHLYGINHETISDLRANFIFLLQQQKELALHQSIDLWKLIVELNHCLCAVSDLLEGEEKR